MRRRWYASSTARPSPSCHVSSYSCGGSDAGDDSAADRNCHQPREHRVIVRIRIDRSRLPSEAQIAERAAVGAAGGGARAR